MTHIVYSASVFFGSEAGFLEATFAAFSAAFFRFSAQNFSKSRIFRFFMYKASHRQQASPTVSGFNLPAWSQRETVIEEASPSEAAISA